MNSDFNVARIGAISAYLDTLGVGGNLYDKSNKLITILDNLESKLQPPTQVKSGALREICSADPCDYCINPEDSDACIQCGCLSKNNFNGRKLLLT